MMLHRVRSLAVVLAVAAVTTTLSAAEPLKFDLPPIRAEPWKFEQFPIIAWWGPPGSARREDFQAYKEAGFNLYLLNPDANYAAAMEHLRTAGLKAMVSRSLQGFGAAGDPVEFDDPKNADVIVGWLTHDEPSGTAAVAQAITAVNMLMRQDPTKRSLFNMLPPAAQGDPPAKAVIDAAVANGLPILSYDQYYIFANDTDAAGPAYEALDLYRKASLEHHVPFWAFALSIRHFDYRRASESDLRWMQFTNLAYGAKGLWYFTYWAPTEWERWDTRAIVDPKDGSKTELYGYAKAINDDVQSMGDTLLKLTNLDVFHVPTTAKSQRALPAGGFDITGVEAKQAIVSFFRHTDGSDYAMVVNARHGMNQPAAAMSDRMTLTFDEKVTKVTAVNWLDGKTGPLEVKDGRAALEIAGGTGVLLKLEK